MQKATHYGPLAADRTETIQMQIIKRETNDNVLHVTDAELETITRALRRMQVGHSSFTLADATSTYAHKRRAEDMHRSLTGRSL